MTPGAAPCRPGAALAAVALAGSLAATGAPGRLDAQQRPHADPGREAVRQPEPFGVFLGNEGVALSSGGDVVVIVDGLFRQGVEGYQTVPEALREQLESGLPVAARTVVLATHEHADHFDPTAVVAHLETARSARFVSTPDAVDRIRDLDPPPEVLETITASLPREGERDTVQLDRTGVTLITLNLHHGRERAHIQNLGYLIDLDGTRVLHMGDTEVTSAEILEQEVADESLDVAFLPYWLLMGDGASAVLEALSATQVYAIHLPRADVDPSWWGSYGSLSGTVEALESLAGVRVLLEPGTRLEIR
ncbi:MAG: MBL fold metallo-hydrolase [Gemmatimonadota bacterium]|nr:MBL fold metallo-hydrolase [Gemmatimonadota bacterium]